MNSLPYKKCENIEMFFLYKIFSVFCVILDLKERSHKMVESICCLVEKLYLCTLSNLDFMETKDKIVLPAGFEDVVRGVIGENEWEAFVDALSDEPSVSVRVNSKITDNRLQITDNSCLAVKWCEWGRYLAERPKFTYDPMFHAGAYYVQEASSMFVWQALEQLVERDAVVLDMCAAPGGKSTAIAQYLSEDGFLVSNEYVPQRAHVLVENITKWGAPNCVVTNNAPRHFEKLKVRFDAILVDAPCSGEGMFRKDERAREEWSKANVEMCVERQREILESAWEVLKPGGVLIYSTCTFNSHENEEQVQWLIDEMEAEYLPLKIGEDWMITETERGYRFLPHKTRGEGLFMAAVRKQITDDRLQSTDNRLQSKSEKRKDKKAKNSTFNIQFTTDDLLRGEYGVVESEGRYYAVQKERVDLVEECRKTLNVLMFGVQMYEQKGKDLIPQAALALSQVYKRGAYPEVELSYEEAIAFLRKEAIVLADAPRGFVLVTYKGLPLGWVKNIGNRCNNLYPEFWRIRN